MDERRLQAEMRRQTAASVVKNNTEWGIIQEKLRSEGVLTSMGARQLILQGALGHSSSFHQQKTKRRSSRSLDSKQNSNRSLNSSGSICNLSGHRNKSDAPEVDKEETVSPEEEAAVVNEICRRLSTTSMDRVVRKILKSDSQQNLAAMLKNTVPIHPTEKNQKDSHSSSMGFNPAGSFQSSPIKPKLRKSTSAINLGSLPSLPSMPNLTRANQRQKSLGSGTTSKSNDRPGLSRTPSSLGLLSSASSSNINGMIVGSKNISTSNQALRRNLRKSSGSMMRHTSSFCRLDDEMMNGTGHSQHSMMMKHHSVNIECIESSQHHHKDDLLDSDHSRKGSLNMSWDKWSQGFDSSSYDNNIYKNVAEGKHTIVKRNSCGSTVKDDDLPKRLSRRGSKLRSVITVAMATLVDELSDDDSEC